MSVSCEETVGLIVCSEVFHSQYCLIQLAEEVVTEDEDISAAVCEVVCEDEICECDGKESVCRELASIDEEESTEACGGITAGGREA